MDIFNNNIEQKDLKELKKLVMTSNIKNKELRIYN